MRSVLSILTIGLCLGYINGISSSPLIGSYFVTIVISALIIAALSAGIKVKWKDFEFESDSKAASKGPVALAILLIGFSIGASGGIFIRNNDLIGVYPKVFVSRWFNAIKIQNPKDTTALAFNDSLKKQMIETVFFSSYESSVDIIEQKHPKSLPLSKEDTANRRKYSIFFSSSTLKTQTSKPQTSYLLSGDYPKIDERKYLCSQDINELRRQIFLSPDSLAKRLAAKYGNDTVLYNILHKIYKCE